MSKVKINFDFENKVNNQSVILENFIENENTIIDKTKDEKIYPENWRLSIPKINLDAKIVDGTTDEILNKYIGHFTETEVINGNICLAAHNRGYDVNYFSGLKNLQIGDSVFYNYDEIKKEYEVVSLNIIKDTDVYVLENTGENILTLITCVEDMPELRRYVKCKEKQIIKN